jgi:hypothetical protein
VRGPGGQNWDIALFKNVPLGGRMRLQLRFEAFNFLNHPNVGNPFDTGVSTGTSLSSLAGVVIDPTNADFGRVLTKTGERNIQLGVKLMF